MVFLAYIEQTPLEIRFWAKVQFDSSLPEVAHLGRCWVWTAAKSSDGYGSFGVRCGARWSMIGAHRVAFFLFNGYWPDTLDHLCRLRSCVRPSHLEAVSRRENTMRSPIARAAVQSRRTHCPNGHLYDLVDDGRRRCRRCRNEKARAAYRTRRSS